MIIIIMRKFLKNCSAQFRYMKRVYFCVGIFVVLFFTSENKKKYINKLHNILMYIYIR